MKRILFFLLFLSLFLPAAQDSDLSGFVAWNDSGDLRTATDRIDLENFSSLGLRYEKIFLGIFGFENTLAYTRGILVPGDAADEDDGLYYTGAFVINIPISRLVPNVAYGMGVLHHFGESFPDSGTSFMTNWGVGVKLRQLFGSGGLRFDYRRLTIYDVLDDNVGTQELSAGVIFSF